jgi:hypothetical protein
MSTPTCCQGESTLLRRAFGAGRWLVPGAILALLPKCPACLAAYVLLWTGIGLSMRIAGIVRTGLLVLSIAVLAWLFVRQVRSFLIRT